MRRYGAGVIRLSDRRHRVTATRDAVRAPQCDWLPEGSWARKVGYTMDLVDNVTVRRVVGEFAAQPDQRRALEVLRSCMYGELLFDITGSDAPVDGSLLPGHDYRSAAAPGRVVVARCSHSRARTRSRACTRRTLKLSRWSRRRRARWSWRGNNAMTGSISTPQVQRARWRPHTSILPCGIRTISH